MSDETVNYILNIVLAVAMSLNWDQTKQTVTFDKVHSRLIGTDIDKYSRRDLYEDLYHLYMFQADQNYSIFGTDLDRKVREVEKKVICSNAYKRITSQKKQSYATQINGKETARAITRTHMKHNDILLFAFCNYLTIDDQGSEHVRQILSN